MVWITLPNEFDDIDNKLNFPEACQLRRERNSFTGYNFLDYLSALHVDWLPHKAWRATNIVCNVGQNMTRDVDTLQRMIESGMNMARFNLHSHYGNLNYHIQTVSNIREAARNYSKKIGVTYPMALGCNTIGPLVRTGYLEGGLDSEIELKAGLNVKVTTDPAFKFKGSAQVIYVDYEDIFDSITVGRTIWIDDGSLKLDVNYISGAFMTCQIIIGGMLGNRRRVNLPGTIINLPTLSEKDEQILQFAIDYDFDFIFCTFVKNVQTIWDVKNQLGEPGKHIKLIANIEDTQGVDNIDEIMKVADGILIARGDLYLEVSIPKMFLAQKYLIAKCNKIGMPVFVSRELIETMMDKEAPALSDVGNLIDMVRDGCTNLMLARETMRGKSFNRLIRYASHVCKEAEAISFRPGDYTELPVFEQSLLHALAVSVVDASLRLWAAAIFVMTNDGKAAEVVSRYRPHCPILAITRNQRVARQLHIYRSVIPFQYTGPFKFDQYKDMEAQINAAIDFGRKRKIIEPSDPIVIVYSGKINTMRVHYVEEVTEIAGEVLYVS